MNFLLIAIFWARELFFSTPSSSIEPPFKPIKTNLDDAVSKPRGVLLLICMLLCLAQVNLEVEMLKRQAMASLCLVFSFLSQVFL